MIERLLFALVGFDRLALVFILLSVLSHVLPVSQSRKYHKYHIHRFGRWGASGDSVSLEGVSPASVPC